RDVLFVYLRQDAVVNADIDARVGFRVLRFEDDADLAVAELLRAIDEQAQAPLVAIGPDGAVLDGPAAVANVRPGRIDLAVFDQGKSPPAAGPVVRRASSHVNAQDSGQRGEKKDGSHRVGLSNTSCGYYDARKGGRLSAKTARTDWKSFAAPAGPGLSANCRGPPGGRSRAGR